MERTVETLGSVTPAKLDEAETRRFQKIVAALPPSVLANESVESKRREERERRDLFEAEEEDNDASADVDVVNDWYRILKNNRILGQSAQEQMWQPKEGTDRRPNTDCR